MCAPGCYEAVRHHLSCRGFLRGAAAGAAAFVAIAEPNVGLAQPASFSHVVDLTHTLSPGFPTFTGEPYLKVEQKMFLDRDGSWVRELTAALGQPARPWPWIGGPISGR